MPMIHVSNVKADNMPWDIIDSDFGGDETANFGPRQESGTALYQIDTLATISSDTQTDYIPNIVTTVLGELASVAVEQHISVFKDCQHTATLGFDSTVDELEWSPDGCMLIVGEHNGRLHVVDASSSDILFAMDIFPSATNKKTFQKIMCQCREDDNYDLTILGFNGQLAVLQNINMNLFLSEEGNIASVMKENLTGSGDTIIAMWKLENGQLELQDELLNCLEKSAGNVLSLWSTSMFIMLKKWSDVEIEDFQLLETKDIKNNSLEGMKLVMLKVAEEGENTLMIQNLPDCETVYTLQLNTPSVLAKCLPVQETLFVAECCVDYSGSSSGVVSMLVHKVKANFLLDQLSPWNIHKYKQENIQEMISQLWKCLESVKEEWPVNALQFLRSVYKGLNAVTEIHLNNSESTCTATDNANKTKLNADEILEPVQRLITNLQHLYDLITKYNCRLTFESFMQETTETVTFRMLDRVVAIELIPSTLEKQIRPYMREHNLKEDKIFFKYVKDLLSRQGRVAYSWGMPAWEPKVIAVIACITDPKSKIEAILETMKFAPIPWSEKIEEMVQSGLQLKHPDVKKIEKQCQLIEIKKIMLKYKLKNIQVSDLEFENSQRLWYFILSQDKVGCMEDALKVMEACKLSVDEELYRFRLRRLISQEKLYEYMELLNSLPSNMALTCGKRIVNFVKVLLEDEEELDPVEYDKYLSVSQYEDEAFRMEVMVSYMKEFFIKRSKQPENSDYCYGKVYRLADILQISHTKLQGELAIKAAKTGSIETAIKMCNKLLECHPTEETAETIYQVALAFLNLQANTENDLLEANQLRDLPEITYNKCMELCKCAYLNLNVSRQCELGEYSFCVESSLSDNGVKVSHEKDWKIDSTFKEDALVMKSSVALPLMAKYSVAHPVLNEDDNGQVDESTDNIPMSSLFRCFIPVMQHLKDNSHILLAYQYALHMISIATDYANRNDFDRDEDESNKFLENIEQNSQTVMKELLTNILTKAVATVGLAVGQVYKEPSVITMCKQLETNAVWGYKLSKYKINFKEAFLCPPIEKIKLLPQVVQVDTGDMTLVKDFCSAFGLDTDEGIMLYLDHVFSTYNEDDHVSSSQLVNQLKNARIAIQEIKKTDSLFEKLELLYTQVHSYDYETLEFLLEEMQKIEANGKREKVALMLENLPVASKTRLPFHPFIDGDPWKILTPELRKDTVSLLLPIAELLKIPVDQIYIVSVQNMVRQHLAANRRPDDGTNSKDASKWNWDVKDANLKLLDDVKDLLTNVSNCELALACASWMTLEMPAGAEKIKGLEGCLALATLWHNALPPEKTREKDKAKAAYGKFSSQWQRLSTEQALCLGKLAEPELLKLANNAEKLLQKLYEHPSILLPDGADKPDYCMSLMKNLSYIVDLESLHIQHSVETFEECNKEGLVKGIWRNHIVPPLTEDQLDTCIHVFNLINRCPVLQDVNLVSLSKMYQKLELPACALACLSMVKNNVFDHIISEEDFVSIVNHNYFLEFVEIFNTSGSYVDDDDGQEEPYIYLKAFLNMKNIKIVIFKVLCGEEEVVMLNSKIKYINMRKFLNFQIIDYC
ncbi:hypothetical protein KUTeg_013086 [Tegillarca granosa]|uniref:Kinetochore-associated protein 1 n=1 Tax=Tegillarca granosa TaxID=220873 RepID=A0ABQ9ESP2_TEGGR|nr:hypothetical protein KUTeg_013086 [Tegillarca granosa]